jgi:hypothetical protein
LRGHTEAGDEPATELVASGILRLALLGFLRQLATFRAGGASRTAQVTALGRFDALFLGQLWQVYGLRVLRQIRSGRRGGPPSQGPDRNDAGSAR